MVKVKRQCNGGHDVIQSSFSYPVLALTRALSLVKQARHAVRVDSWVCEYAEQLQGATLRTRVMVIGTRLDSVIYYYWE